MFLIIDHFLPHMGKSKFQAFGMSKEGGTVRNSWEVTYHFSAWFYLPTFHSKTINQGTTFDTKAHFFKSQYQYKNLHVTHYQILIVATIKLDAGLFSHTMLSPSIKKLPLQWSFLSSQNHKFHSIIFFIQNSVQFSLTLQLKSHQHHSKISNPNMQYIEWRFIASRLVKGLVLI
jgi:hypothetical protein